MAHRAVTIDLVRDGQCTPWGFRMSGGADIGTPLLIQRVNMGSPSEGELQKGDIILGISDYDAQKLSHHRASEIISKTGNNLRLIVARSFGPPPPMSPISSPTPGAPLTIYHLKSNPTPTTPYISGCANPDLFKPLPKTEFHNEVKRTYNRYDVLCNDNDARDEKRSISNQAYRTLPLITPGLKTTKDYPIGSYLRHNPDTSGRSKSATNIGNRITDAYMLTRVQEAVLEKALSSPRASVSSSRTPTPDSGYQSIYHRQYNSPINMYSTQSLIETINAQMGAQKISPFVSFESFKEILLDAMTRISGDKSEQPPARVGTPTKSLPDLLKSPTFQVIHEEEWKDLHKQNLSEHNPVQNRLYNVHAPPKSGYESFDIQQSSSFKAVMNKVKTLPTVE